ncbi:MAG: SAM-dependent methyltransferase, partial [Paenibacillus sp.]|nr:SAM-dependent methyltransferase [Paenibacillus sp.]
MKENAGNAAPSRFIVTSNRGFAAYAQDELRALAPGSKFDELVEAETYVLRCPLPRNEALRRIAEQEPIFLRHLFPVDDAVPIAGGEKAIGRIVAAVAAMYSSAAEQARMAAIQIRKSDGFDGGFEPADLREAIGDKLKEAFAIETVVKQSDRIVSVYLSDDTAYIGISTASDNLSDWPGGAIRFRKEEGQASRAKFKLLEAEYTFGLDMSRY